MLEMKLTFDVIGLDRLTAALNRLADRQPTVVNEGTINVDMSDTKEEVPKKTTKKKATKKAEVVKEEEKPTPVEEKKEAPAPVEEKKGTPNPFAAPTPEPKKEYSYEEISRAGSALIDQGKLTEVMALFNKFGVQALNQIDPGKYGEFAEELKKLGTTF